MKYKKQFNSFIEEPLLKEQDNQIKQLNKIKSLRENRLKIAQIEQLKSNNQVNLLQNNVLETQKNYQLTQEKYQNLEQEMRKNYLVKQIGIKDINAVHLEKAKNTLSLQKKKNDLNKIEQDLSCHKSLLKQAIKQTKERYKSLEKMKKMIERKEQEMLEHSL